MKNLSADEIRKDAFRQAYSLCLAIEKGEGRCSRAIYLHARLLGIELVSDQPKKIKKKISTKEFVKLANEVKKIFEEEENREENLYDEN